MIKWQTCLRLREQFGCMCCVLIAADILKANDEVIRVMALYEDTVHKPDVDSLLIDHSIKQQLTLNSQG